MQRTIMRAATISGLVTLAGACGGADPGPGVDDDTSGTESATAGEASVSASEGDTGTSVGTGATTTATTADSTADESTGPAEPYCGDGMLDPDEECDDGNDDDFDGCTSECVTIELLDPPELEWTYVEVDGTVCLDGSTAGFGINYNPDSTNVMIYLEGGGACFNDSCDFTAFSVPFLPPSDGIFNRSIDANPVRDWTMIYVPYCTGDIHSGDGEGVLGGEMRYFHGYSNITRYLQTWVPSIPADRVLLTGISAGGFGAATNAAQVADAYGPGVEINVVDDSGPPLSNQVIPPCLQEIFRSTWNLDGTVLADCPGCDPHDFARGLLAHTLTTHPELRYGLFSNTADLVIRTYMGFGWGGGTYDTCEGTPLPVPAQAYTDDLDEIRAQNMADISTFYVFGLGHTALRVGFYTTFADGTTLPQWLAGVLDGDVDHVGP